MTHDLDALNAAADIACDLFATAEDRVRRCLRASRRCRRNGGRGAARAERRVWAFDRACRQAEAARGRAMRAAHAAWVASGAAELD